ncbi:hydroxyacylglutathione hydrolase [Prochlorococcus marinus str. XMU1401]|uniref:Hydroxyacylglutathione hydrolase n=1 Tax=Prochlorococcus marinus str. XMU1401 TaxID=2052594 RepID=A0A8I1WZ86_PROMR|nr:hydroxyacylglutathione hydrolase [Prochlorococcus marinus]MBO8222451.1 hydroxyacylglutathione hydrolase [Prochlorococcus marinus str. XMU1401]MBW3060825.1 hydroxyacylglutathione hydrolase [Prochlorococcus marinus str. XMU1401E]MCQ9197906.1 hydroxyacylglutathione hydrolase [Prochlorococcus marinus XMU1429]PJC84227.1 hydroxyacylglutathione hydrolase [Prochlorococcus marinus str. XMU1401]
MDFNKARNIIGLRVLSDNVIWLLVKDKSVVVIDPSVHEPVVRYINENNFHLEAILQTHHHSDHIGGTKSLIEKWPNVKVIASSKEKKRIPFQNVSVEDGETLNILGEEVKIIEVLGHTNSHIAFFLNGEDPVLFIGDTLFSGGCGRIFEGTYQQMYSSLERIKSLPKNTLIYCAHEYTKENILWALNLKPKDQDIKNKLSEVEKKLSLNELTIPFLLDEEMKINLFLRAKNLEEFTFLRANKDLWV